MTEPLRLRDCADGSVGEMLRAGRTDGPRDAEADRRRLLAALDNLSVERATSAPSRASRWMFGAVAGVGVAFIGGLLLRSALPDDHAAVMPPVSARVAPAPSVEAEVPSDPTQAPAVPSIDVRDLPSGAVRLPNGGTHRAAPPVKSSAAAPVENHGALDELAAVARVRKELTHGDTASARRDIALYRETFAQGRFAEEIAALEIEAIAAEGSRPAVEAKAAEFLTRYPSSPYARRVRSVVQSRATTGAP